MNPNDYIAQQQALVDQYMQNYQHLVLGAIVVQIALMFIGAWVIYMFYARLRDIADELRQFRIAYQMAEGGKASGDKSKGGSS